MIKTARQLIEAPSNLSHVVVLGAGASRAAFPNGDAAGQLLPVMDNLIDIVKLRPLIEQAGLKGSSKKNFEVIYAQLASDPRHVHIVREIEHRIEMYFSALLLPNRATIYDRLLLSLRPTDTVITFNWDPFLFDAYQRNRNAVPLPEISFLHGNVRIGTCLDHNEWGAREERCSVCSASFTKVPLLYPITQKDYSTNPYIKRNWDSARELFTGAFTLTIFGYGAPDSDNDAVELLRLAWISERDRRYEHIQIIDTGDQSLLEKRWSSFTPTRHYSFKTTFEQSRVGRWPRRSCESLFYTMTQGIPCENFSLPNTDNITELQTYAANIASHEGT